MSGNEPEYFTIELGDGVPSYAAYLRCVSALQMLQPFERERLLLKLADEHRYLLSLEKKDSLDIDVYTEMIEKGEK